MMKEKIIKESICKMIEDIKEIDRLVAIYTFIKHYKRSNNEKNDE